jgi:hypothetical protein
MRADEFISEVTDPRAAPPKPGSSEFELSKQTFIKIINANIENFNKNLTSLKAANPNAYKTQYGNNKAIAAGLFKAVSDALVRRGSGNITSNDIERFKQVWPMKFTGVKQSPTFSPTTMAVPFQKPVEPVPTTRQGVPLKDLSDKPAEKQQKQPQKPEPIRFGKEVINPDNPLYDKIMKGRTPESVNEANIQFDKKSGQVKVDPKDISQLADIATQRWYINRDLKMKNPQAFAALSGNNTGANGNNSSNSAFGGGKGQDFLQAFFKMNPNDPNFAQALVNYLGTQKSGMGLVQAADRAGITPQKPTTK